MFQNLRNNELYRNSLYVNYEAINKAMHPLCKRNKLSNPGLKQQFQWMLSCPGREAIVQNNVPFERYEFYNEIHIYPESNLKIKSGEENAMMVFQYIQSTDTYTLLEIYDNLIWNSQNLVVNQLLNVPPPTAFDDAETVNKIKLYKETFDKFRFVIILLKINYESSPYAGVNMCCKLVLTTFHCEFWKSEANK